MGAKNNNSSNKQYYKLKEDKRDGSQTKGQFVFFKQAKNGDSWGDSEEYNAMSGHLKDISISSFEWQGKTKEMLNIDLLDDEDNETQINISLGFDTITAQNIINTLAGEPIIGIIEFSAGKPSEYKGKSYPTLYIKNQGQKTKWKYSKENNNLELVPKITSFTDDDGNTIKKGTKVASEFWKKELDLVKAKLNGTPSIKQEVMAKNEAKAEAKSDLPWDENEGIVTSDKKGEKPPF